MTYTKDALKEAIQQKLRLNYGCTEKQATDGEIMKACCSWVRSWVSTLRTAIMSRRARAQAFMISPSVACFSVQP